MEHTLGGSFSLLLLAEISQGFNMYQKYRKCFVVHKKVLISLFLFRSKNGDTDIIFTKEPSTPPIFNYVSSVENPITWKDFMALSYKEGFKVRV